MWIDVALVRAIHERLLVQHGGARGLRDAGLLSSAVARPQQMAAYDGGADVLSLAAALTTALVRHHPFIDGNKRTGFVAGVLFLELNGGTFSAPEDAAAAAVMGLADGTLDEQAYAGFLREHAGRE